MFEFGFNVTRDPCCLCRNQFFPLAVGFVIIAGDSNDFLVLAMVFLEACHMLRLVELL